jgi:hypothetical protein
MLGVTGTTAPNGGLLSMEFLSETDTVVGHQARWAGFSAEQGNLAVEPFLPSLRWTFYSIN